jgi:hypothetical protein
MKTLAMCTLMLVLAAGPVFASSCGGGDKDKDDQAFTMNVQLLCGGDKGDKPAPEMMGDSCGRKKDKDCDKPKPAPEPEPELFCGGDKGDKPAPAPELFCGGDKGDKPAPAPELFCGGDKDKKDTKV